MRKNSLQSKFPQVRDRAITILFQLRVKISFNLGKREHGIKVKVSEFLYILRFFTAEIDLRYLDESRFSLKADIPDGWQEQSEIITFKSCQSKRIHVLGLMECKNQLNYEIHQGVIDSEIVINF
ncbi:MAG: hypothetical protein F6K25_24850 [Okeania sp. SIO2G4]|uniref:hypothetical protein n=1 Tax=unclassified Okeania TaxID=2634635 RepID=UPI0013BF2FDF|nr:MULTISPECIES: hypothetical protein [unclassified Okeania]NEP07507.1 hypothetical protein [Okeania sp. SIO4D6]NEP39681.1 hypothetical protein [Okeania sp. SIO2H7]NEP74872.1 hypothetical protein [Okeania sp. SIO2G5]NEQ93708.1 hypothetical protein [Okeania sp. SIO2G4]